MSSTCALVVLLFQISTEDDSLIAMVYSVCFSSWCVCIASRVEHVKTVSPSHLLQFLLLLSVPYEAFWLKRIIIYDNVILRTSAYVHAVVLAILICVESCGKRNLFMSETDRRLSAEETCGLFERRLFWYLNGLFRKGNSPPRFCGNRLSPDQRIETPLRLMIFKGSTHDWCPKMQWNDSKRAGRGEEISRDARLYCAPFLPCCGKTCV